MRISLVAIGDRMDRWVDDAVAEYARRLPREWKFELVEIAAAARTRNPDIERAKAAEGARQLRAVPPGARVIAFDEEGRTLDTRAWAKAIQRWQQDGRDVSLLIGGADGLAPACLERAETKWSLSALTLPHGLARVLVVEQLYRAWSLNAGHPYHRA